VKIEMRRYLWIIFIAGVILFSCKNPFKIRNSPAPSGPRGTFNPPTSPETVIQNLYYAYTEKIIDNYIICFSDSFIFSAPEDSLEAISQNRPELFWNWNLSVERNVTNALFNLYTSGSKRLVILLSKNPDQPDVSGDSSAVLYRNYTIYFYDVSLGEPLIGTAQGNSTFYLKESSYDLWNIYFWEDRPLLTGGLDWADLKAQFR
jgi:hypothetical protein